MRRERKTTKKCFKYKTKYFMYMKCNNIIFDASKGFLHPISLLPSFLNIISFYYLYMKTAFVVGYKYRCWSYVYSSRLGRQRDVRIFKNSSKKEEATKKNNIHQGKSDAELPRFRKCTNTAVFCWPLFFERDFHYICPKNQGVPKPNKLRGAELFNWTSLLLGG